MNGYLVVIVGALLLRFVVDAVAELLNLGHVRTDVPGEFAGVYDDERYATSQRYLRETTRLGLLDDTLSTLIQLTIILAGGFVDWFENLGCSRPKPVIRKHLLHHAQCPMPIGIGAENLGKTLECFAASIELAEQQFA